MIATGSTMVLDSSGTCVLRRLLPGGRPSNHERMSARLRWHSDGPLVRAIFSPCQTRSASARLLVRLGGHTTVTKTAELLPGTLDMMILKAVSLKPLHGYGVLLRIRQISKDALEIPQGSLYPALYRLEHHGLITAEWGQSE